MVFSVLVGVVHIIRILSYYDTSPEQSAAPYFLLVTNTNTERPPLWHEITKRMAQQYECKPNQCEGQKQEQMYI